jgi:hypothetical protein
MHTPFSNTLKNLNSLQSIIGKFELGPTSMREFGLTASLNDRFAPILLQKSVEAGDEP